MQLKQLKKIKEAISVFDLFDQVNPPKVIFNTQRDNRVDDKICLKLAGVAFEIDDPLRPIIPDDTHPNCRCFYTDEITGQIVTDISSKRDIKRRKKLPPESKHYLTQKKMDLIVKTMEQNEEWQSKSKNFIPSDDTGIRPLTDKPKLRKDLRPYDKASLEQISKWIKAIV